MVYMFFWVQFLITNKVFVPGIVKSMDILTYYYENP